MGTTSPWLERVAAELWDKRSFSFIPATVLADPQGDARRATGPRVAFCGFPSDYSLAFLVSLLAADVELVGIITSPGAHPAILGTNALSQVAEHLHVPLLRHWRVNDEHARGEISALRLDAVVMASFDQIIGARALALPQHGWLNVHPSALPAYRGPEPVYWAIADGAAQTGITLHRAVPRFDAGPVFAQRRVPIDATDTAGTLTRRLCAAGAASLAPALQRALSGDPGDELDMGGASYRPSVGHRNLNDASSAAEAERMVRAGIPNMPAWAELDGRPVYALSAHVVDAAQAADLRFTDGGLRLDERRPTCGCHHDREDCPHLERPSAAAAT